MVKIVLNVLVAIVVSFFIVSGFNMAYAKSDKCPPGSSWGPAGCVSDSDGSGSSNTTNINTAFGGSGGDAKAYGGDADASAKAYGGDSSIDIGNGMFNKNLSPEASAVVFNDTDNEIDMDQKQKQDQDQEQSQAAIAIQGQKAVANNAGNKQTTNVVVEGDKVTYKEQPNHINPVSGPDTDSETTRSRGHDALTFGSIMDKVSGLPVEGIKMAAKDASDVRILTAVFFEPPESVNYVRVGSDGEFSGYLYADCDDDVCSAAGMEAKAMLKASELGYTHIKRVHVSAGEKLYGSEWSVKLGGGASVAASGGNMMIAPGGGIGGGAAESSTVDLPAMTFEVYYNPLFINVKK